MCKIMIIPGCKTGKKLMEFSHAAFPHLTEQDNDAFGYVAVAKSTGMFGERWTSMADVFKSHTSYSKQDLGLLHALSGQLDVPRKNNTHNTFGQKASDVHTIMLHGRYATCGKGLENAHPFVSKVEGVKHAMIHNGVISNSLALNLNRTSTCDSEVILNLYTDNNVATDASRIQTVADSLQGWYAAGVISEQDDRFILDVFRDAQAPLYVAWVTELDTMVFCTSEEIIRKTCKDVDMHHGNIFKVASETLTRIDCESGKILDKTTFVSGLASAARYADDWERDLALLEANTEQSDMDVIEYLDSWKKKA